MSFQKSACIEPLYADIPFLQRFQAAKADGFDFVEFWGWEDKDLDAVQQAARAAGIGIHGFNGDAHFSLIDPAHKQPYLAYLRRSVQAAKKIGARSVTIHSNELDAQGRVVDPYWALSDTVKLCAMFDTLLACAEIAQANQIVICLEALNITTDHVGNYLRHTQTAAEMTRLIGSPWLKILYDVYHMQINEGSLCDTLTQYIDQIGHIHIADAPGRHEPGTGEINYPTVIRHLDKLGYTGLIGCELMPKTDTATAVRAIMDIF